MYTLWIRARLLQWCGHLIRLYDPRLDHQRLVYQAIQHIYHHRQLGDLLMDVPQTDIWDELIKLAKNRDNWCIKVNSQQTQNSGSQRPSHQIDKHQQQHHN